MNTPVSLEIDKLLLQKGIDMPVSPTIADVIMGLYKKHRIWIFSKKENGLFQSYIQHPESINNWFSKLYNSPTEAYEKAIEHTLKNLI